MKTNFVLWHSFQISTMFLSKKEGQPSTQEYCPVHVIWTARRMSKLVLKVKHSLFLSFFNCGRVYNLGHIQGIIRVP